MLMNNDVSRFRSELGMPLSAPTIDGKGLPLFRVELNRIDVIAVGSFGHGKARIHRIHPNPSLRQFLSKDTGDAVHCRLCCGVENE